MDIRLVILDFDGTVGDTNELITGTMLAAIAELGLESRTHEECSLTIGLPLAACFRQLYPGLSDSQAERCAETYRKIFKENFGKIETALFPHVEETLRRLKGQDVRLAIASSRRHASLQLMVDTVGIREYVDFIIGTDEVEHPKPAADLARKALAHFGIRPENALVVGDAPYDILMGRRAGCRTCGVTYGNGTPEELRAAGADRLVDDFARILPDSRTPGA